MFPEDRDGGSPRSGLLGAWDGLVGPDATRTEETLILGYGLLFTGGLLLYVRFTGLEWTLLQRAIVALFALDIAGGIVANTTQSGVRWWHRPSRTRRDHFEFVALHLHPFALAWAFAGVSWVDAAVVYGFLILGAITVLRCSGSLRRPVATTLFSVGLLLAIYVVEFGAGLEWFVPFLYLKLIVGHLVDAR